jgi:hypothetical protein
MFTAIGKRFAGIVITSCLFYMTGCSSIKTQFSAAEEPSDGERARLRITANMLVKAVPNRNCIDWNAPGAGTVFGGIVGSSGYRGRSLGMPGTPAKGDGSGEMYVRAEQPFTLVLQSTPESRYRCNISGFFVPKANQDYEAVLNQGRLDLNHSVCTLRIINLNAPDQPVDFERAPICR